MSFNYHIHESNIKCPYCDKECRDDDYEVAKDFDIKIEFECEHCGKIFQAESTIVFNTYADCALNKKAHDLIETHVVGFFKCNDCEHYEDTRKHNPALEPTNITDYLPTKSEK